MALDFEHADQYKGVTLSLTANASNVNLDAGLIGGYLFSVKIKSSVDDAVTFQMFTADGTPFFSAHTTTAATTGEWVSVPDRYPINDLPKYTLSNFSGSGTLTVEITVAIR